MIVILLGFDYVVIAIVIVVILVNAIIVVIDVVMGACTPVLNDTHT